VGLWDADTHEGDDGFRFHEWEERNGTREKIEAKRADDAERKRRWREQQSRKRDGTYGPNDDGPGGGRSETLFDTPATQESERSPNGVTVDVPRDVPRDETRDSDRSPDGIREESHRSQPNPTQPIPSPNNKDSFAAPRRTRSRSGPIDYSAEFEAFWSACHPDRKRGKGDAAKAFTKACRGAPLRQGESRATTLTARMAVWVGHWQETGADPRFTPLPATWLNGQRYDDPPPSRPGSQVARRGPDLTANGGLGTGTTAERVNSILSLKSGRRGTA
jgi:hypothetical protein